MRMVFRKPKIVCMPGPVSSSPERIRQLESGQGGGIGIERSRWRGERREHCKCRERCNGRGRSVDHRRPWRKETQS